MKKYNSPYYLLFILLVIGAFASMAQNDYGNTILGGVALAFFLLFVVQLISSFTTKNKVELMDMLEFVSLTLLSGILALRVFYIHFQFVELIFGIAGLVLIAVYMRKLVQSWQTHNSINKVLAMLMAAFHGSIILYAVSMTIVPFVPSLAEPAGAAAFALLIAFVLVGYVKRDLMLGGEKVSAFRVATRFKDRSVVLLALFLLFTAYMGLTKIGAIPKMYSDEFPQAYFELVNKAESGQEKAVEGKYRHEEFKEMYDRFISRQGEGKK